MKICTMSLKHKGTALLLIVQCIMTIHLGYNIMHVNYRMDNAKTNSRTLAHQTARNTKNQPENGISSISKQKDKAKSNFMPEHHQYADSTKRERNNFDAIQHLAHSKLDQFKVFSRLNPNFTYVSHIPVPGAWNKNSAACTEGIVSIYRRGISEGWIYLH